MDDRIVEFAPYTNCRYTMLIWGFIKDWVWLDALYIQQWPTL
jgi:hypothetical protein